MFEQYIGRWVAFVLTPLLLPLAGTVAVKANQWLGLDLTGEELTGYVVTTVVGVAAILYKWLHNRGEFEKAVNAVEDIYNTGEEVLEGEKNG